MSKPIALKGGAVYHVYNRGNNREDIFVEPRNYRHFLLLMARHVLPVADIYAYCLLRNHFHLLLRVRTEEEQRAWAMAHAPDGRLPESWKGKAAAQALGNCFNAYAKAFNKTYSRTGSLFEHPFKRIEVASARYFARLVVYIHRNPERHGLVGDFRDWPHSSFHALRGEGSTRLDRETVHSWFEGRGAFEAMHARPEGFLKPFGSDGLQALAPDDFD